MGKTASGPALSCYLYPPQRRNGPTSSDLSAFQQEVSPHYLQRPPRPQTIQRTKFFKIIDCHICPSLRLQLKAQLHLSDAIPITNKARRKNAFLQQEICFFYVCLFVLFIVTDLILVWFHSLFPFIQFVLV
jgi:hypothetical protein